MSWAQGASAAVGIVVLVQRQRSMASIGGQWKVRGPSLTLQPRPAVRSTIAHPNSQGTQAKQRFRKDGK
jgi:hypothetical protein